MSGRPFGMGSHTGITGPTGRGLLSYGSDSFLGVYGVGLFSFCHGLTAKKGKERKKQKKQQPCNGQVDVQF